LIALDQLGNAVFGGNPDQTISGRLGQIKRAHGGVVPRWKGLGLARPLDAFLDWLEPGHSEESVEEDEE
jgi:hypothetical protein